MSNQITFYELSELNKKNNKKIIDFFIVEKKRSFKEIVFEKDVIISNYLKKGSVFYIIEGNVLRSFLDIEAEEKSLDILGEYEFLGISSLENGVPLNSEIVALTKTKVLKIPQKLFLEFPSETLPVLYSNYQYTFNVLYLNWRASLAPGNERINTALISIAYYLGRQDQFGNYFLPNYLTHKIIASFSSVSRSYVTKCIKKLISEGIILMQQATIVIKDIEGLKKCTPSYQPF